MIIKVNVVLQNKEGKILVVKRSEKDGGFWQTITGTVEPTDLRLVEAVKREVKEETGLDVIVNAKPFYFFTWEKEDREVIEICFWAYLRDNNDRVILSNEHTAYGWSSIEVATEIVEKESNKKVLDIFKSI